MIVIIAPPPSVAYPFILDVEGYPGQIINLFIVLVSPIYPRQVYNFLIQFQGLFWLRWKKPHAHRPFKGDINCQFEVFVLTNS